MNIKNRIKKFGAGIMASLCAVSVIGNTVSYAANADITKENVAFPTADEVIAQAATLLGSPYGWGFKGYTGAYYQDSYSPLSLDTVRSQGVDCSGLIYYTLTHLGYSTSGFSWNNPVPVDTPHWLSVNDNCTVSYSGISSKIEVEKENIPYTERPYWECADGSTITAGSVVIADNLAGEDHSWIYMGEFDSRQEVVDYLLNIGVDASYINDRTVGDGSGEGGTHWRIESNGSQGCVINNRTDGKKATSMNMYAFRITQDKVKKSPNGTIRINKTSEDGQNGDRTFTVTGGGETYTLTTGADGTAILADIPVFDSNNAPITYAISEKDVPVRYVVPDEQKTTLDANETVEVTFENRLKKFTAEVTKKDSENGTAQGNASLAGAVYGLYRDGERVAQYTTDENGYFKTDEYPCGNYTLQELTPSQGYQLNDEIYSVGAEPENYKVEANAVEMSVDENVIKGNISIVKHSDNDENTVENLESGAEFEIFLKSSGSYDSANESERDRLVTDENGFAETKDMPYGTYTVHQTKTVNDAEYAADFDVNIIENGKTYEYILNDKPFTSYIQIIKADSETGRTIPYEGAGFQIYNADGEIVDLGTDTFYTNNEGCLITPETLTYGEYSLVEVQAPIGYVLDSTPVPFTVSADNAEEKIIKVTKNDTAQKGRISVTKTGDIFRTVEAVSSAYCEDELVVDLPVYKPVFEKCGLKDAVFEIIAAEDIYTADGTLRAAGGDTVDTIITDESGYAETEPLYLGKYEIKEISAPYGYVVNEESKFAELTYSGQDIAVNDAVNCTMNNEYQRINIRFSKSMESDRTFGTGMNNEYRNVRFGLFAAEDITSADGTSIPENGLIAEIGLNDDMTAEFTEKLPFSRYYVQEISTDESYVLNGEKYLVNFEYTGQTHPTVDIDCGTFHNKIKRGDIMGMKINENGEPLEKAVFGLFRSDETEFTEESAYCITQSDEEGRFSFSDIPYGEYIVKETGSPTGYVLSDELYPVVIGEDGDAAEITAENRPVDETKKETPVTPTVPTTPMTGDAGRSPVGLVMLILGVTGLLYAAHKCRKKESEYEHRERELAALCPDFIEGDSDD